VTPGQVERRHPGWHVWPSVTGHLWYARRVCSSPPKVFRAKRLADLPAGIETFTYLDNPGRAS